MDTYVGRRNISRYQVVRQEGLELLIAPGLARHARRLDIHLGRFIFWRRLQAQVELPEGMTVRDLRAV